MTRQRILTVLGIGAVAAGCFLGSSNPASADDARVSIQPALQQAVNDQTNVSVTPVRHGGWRGGGWGGGWGGWGGGWGGWGGYYRSPGFSFYAGPRYYGGYYGGYYPYYGGYSYAYPSYYYYPSYSYYW